MFYITKNEHAGQSHSDAPAGVQEMMLTQEVNPTFRSMLFLHRSILPAPLDVMLSYPSSNTAFHRMSVNRSLLLSDSVCQSERRQFFAHTCRS